MSNFENLMIGLSEVKNTLSEVVNNGLTKIIVKNNKPVSVLVPYEEYKVLESKAKEGDEIIGRVGNDITLDNGVQIMVTVSKGGINDSGIAIKTFVKMKTSGDYKLHFTQYIPNPSVESTYTPEELAEISINRYKEGKEIILTDKDKESEGKYEVK